MKMKNMLAVLLSVLLLLSLAACTENITPKENKEENDMPDAVTDEEEKDTFVSFLAQYTRTFDHSSYDGWPEVILIRTFSEFQAFLAGEGHAFDLYEIPHPNDEYQYEFYNLGFLNVSSLYDEAYFEDHVLVVVYAVTSSSFRFGVEDVTFEDGKLSIQLAHYANEGFSSDDDVEWLITIEPQQGIQVDSVEDIAVDVTQVAKYIKLDERRALDKERLNGWFKRMDLAYTVE